MEAYQQRVVAEKAELDAKMADLVEFNKSATFFTLPKEEQDRLNDQVVHMRHYSDTLKERIANFV